MHEVLGLAELGEPLRSQPAEARSLEVHPQRIAVALHQGDRGAFDLLGWAVEHLAEPGVVGGGEDVVHEREAPGPWRRERCRGVGGMGGHAANRLDFPILT